MQQRLDEIANEIRACFKRTGLEMLVIGQRLIEAKDLLGNRAFANWVEDELRITERTAQNFMNVTRRFMNNKEIISVFPPTILYALAAPSTPTEAIDLVLERVQQGEILTVSEVKQVIRDQVMEQAVNAGVRAGKTVFTEAVATNGFVSIGGDSVALDAAITEEMVEASQRQRQHIREGYERKHGLADDPMYKAKGTVDYIDKPRGFITLHVPDLAAVLKRGDRVQIVLYVKQGAQ